MAADAGIREATRRELIARGIALAGTGSDTGALRATVRAEQVLVATYEQLLGAGVLGASAARAATEFVAHERAHVAALTSELRRLGGKPPREPRGLGPVRPAGERAAIRLLLGLERAAISVYYTELAQLQDGRAARTAAEIMACEAQHTLALRELLSPGDVSRAVPGAFVYGTR
jgi:rubrerythrin